MNLFGLIWYCFLYSLEGMGKSSLPYVQGVFKSVQQSSFPSIQAGPSTRTFFFRGRKAMERGGSRHGVGSHILEIQPIPNFHFGEQYASRHNINAVTRRSKDSRTKERLVLVHARRL